MDNITKDTVLHDVELMLRRHKIEKIEKKTDRKEPIRVFLSLPMSGRSDEEIKAQIKVMQAEFLLKNPFDNGEEIIFVHNFSEKECVTNTYGPFFGERKTPALYYLGRAINKMAYCDAVYVGDGFTKARGCMIEYQIAMDYQIPVYHKVENLIRKVS